MSESVALNCVVASDMQLYSKKTPNEVFLREFSKIFKNKFFCRTALLAISVAVSKQSYAFASSFFPYLSIALLFSFIYLLIQIFPGRK